MTFDEHAEAIKAAIEAAKDDGFTISLDYDSVDSNGDEWGDVIYLLKTRWNEFGWQNHSYRELWRG